MRDRRGGVEALSGGRGEADDLPEFRAIAPVRERCTHLDPRHIHALDGSMPPGHAQQRDMMTVVAAGSLLRLHASDVWRDIRRETRWKHRALLSPALARPLVRRIAEYSASYAASVT